MDSECVDCVSPDDFDIDIMSMPDAEFEKVLKNLGTCRFCCHRLKFTRKNACKFCQYSDVEKCIGDKKCKTIAGRDEAHIKSEIASVCRDLVKPISCPLELRIVALAHAADITRGL